MDSLLVIKILYTLFMIVMIPVYLKKYGPTNFLYICDMALLLTLAGLWMDIPLLISMSAVGIIAAQILWVLDLLGTLLGFRMTGMTAYMFNSKTPLFLRSLSLFHGWLPFLLIFLVYKIGYDPRAFVYWTELFWVIMICSVLVLKKQKEQVGLKPGNINFVWGLRDGQPQTWMPRKYWILILMIGLPILLFYPTHLFLLLNFHLI